MLNFSPRLRPRQEYGVKTLTRGFLILNFAPRLRDTLTRGCWIGKRRKSFFDGKVAGLAREGVREVTIKISTPVIYIVNTSLQSKY
jgi:hypothetical protein